MFTHTHTKHTHTHTHEISTTPKQIGSHTLHRWQLVLLIITVAKFVGKMTQDKETVIIICVAHGCTGWGLVVKQCTMLFIECWLACYVMFTHRNLLFVCCCFFPFFSNWWEFHMNVQCFFTLLWLVSEFDIILHLMY
jgi:hypothetical protein